MTLFYLLLSLGIAAAPAHPLLCFDEVHHNVHTSTTGYASFVDLARSSGYEVVPIPNPWTTSTLAACSLLVVVSPRGAGKERPLQERALPAFTDPEVSALADWLTSGRGLLLITDHAPIGAATKRLASRLGVDMSNAFTEDPEHTAPSGFLLFSRENGLLGSHPITNGRSSSERVTTVGTFLGQSLAGPPEAASLLTFGPKAKDRVRASTDRLWLDPSPQDVLHPASGRSQALAFGFGAGRAVVLGDAAMLTSLGTDSGFDTPGLDNRQFAINILRWLSAEL